MLTKDRKRLIIQITMGFRLTWYASAECWQHFWYINIALLVYKALLVERGFLLICTACNDWLIKYS